MAIITQSYTDGPDSVRADTDDNYFLDLLGGDDRMVHTGVGASEFNLGDGSDVVYLYGSNGLARGGLGDDFAHFNGLSNRFEGGDGDDYISLRGGRYHRGLGGDGNDRFYVTDITFGLKLWGDAGNDSFYGNDLLSSGQLYGGDGNDSFFGFGSQLDHNGLIRRWTILGGAGDDFYQLSLSGSVRIYERAHEGTDTVEVALGQSYTLGSSVENLQVGILDTGFDGAILTGNTLSNRISGGDRSEILQGLGGNDTLIGGGGDDRLEGGDGSDTYYVDGNNDTVVETADGGYDTVNVTATNYVLPDYIETLLISGGIPGGTVTGNARSNYIQNDDNARTIIAAGGQDNIRSGAGDDVIYAGGVPEEYPFYDNDTVDAGAGDDTVYGGADGDRLYGGDGNDVIYGEDGEDQLEGAAGSDTLAGGAGNDYYVVDDLDTLIEEQGQGQDTVQVWGSNGYTLPDFIEFLLFSGYNDGAVFTGNNLDNYIGPRDLGATSGEIYGLGGNDILRSGGGDDFIDGGSGDDEIVRGFGQDEITGGAGDDWIHIAGSFDPGALIHGDRGSDTIDAWADRIVYTSWTDTGFYYGIDSVRLFADGTTIDLSAVDANLAVDGHQHLALVGNDPTPGVGELYEVRDLAGNLTGYAANLDGDADIEFSFMISSQQFGNPDVQVPMYDYDIIV